MAGSRKILQFWRGARRHPKWDMGTPPNPRGKRPFRPARRAGRGKVVLFGGVLALVLIGPATLDATSLLWRESKGCRVWRVVDGDTVKMLCPKQGLVSGRLLGFDTPEIKAHCPQELARAVAATYALRWRLWTAAEVTATPRGRDRYDRVLTLFAIDGAPVGRSLVEAGLARFYNGGARKSWCG